MLKTKLFDGRITVAQMAIIGFWLLNLGLVLALWATTAIFASDISSVLESVGLLCGLLATYFALTQFMLMGRIAWIERRFGLDHLASYHRINGYLAIGFILVHPVFITVSYALRDNNNIIREFINLILYYNYVWLALIGQLLFIGVVISSIYIVRRRLKFESWYYVHLMVYVAIISVSLHQLTIGTSFVGGHPLARDYWLGLYGFVALNILIWRLGLPIWNLLRFDFRIDKVVPETPTTTSVYIRGKGLDRWRSQPGQFILVRIFAKGFWGEEHPFSLSWIPHDDLLRITVRHIGDYTSAIAKLQPGKRVLVSGPFGRFTHEVATANKCLFIAGGVGITPIRSLAEEALGRGIDCILLDANRTPDDVVLEAEVEALAQKGLKTTLVYSHPPKGYKGITGYVDIERITKLVPDYQERDIYLCGPAAMMTGIITSLHEAGFKAQQLHYERFALHN